MPGEGGGADDGRRPAVLAVRPVAVVRVGQLAPAGSAELPAVREPPVLVAQPQVDRL